MTYKLTFDPKSVDAAVDRAFRETAFLYGLENTRVISTPGLFPEFDGDIVDTGQLRSSQELTFPAPNTALLTWNVEYAPFVHEGGTYRDGRRFQGRPWTQLALTISLQVIFAKLYQRYSR